MLEQMLYNGPSLKVLHEAYAKRGRVDDRAPVKAAREVRIEAPVERVWARLTDFPSWPTVDSAFRDVRLESAVAVDARFVFTLNNTRVEARFGVVDPCRELTWTGTALWFKAVDRYVLQPADNAATRLYLEESFAGALAPLLLGSARLQAQHDRWLSAFKKAVEGGR